jgi:hypothetical protein
MSLLTIERKRSQNPDPLKPERVGHPENLIQSLGVYVLEWYHPTVSVRQQKKRERVGHPPFSKLSWRPLHAFCKQPDEGPVGYDEFWPY